MATRKDLIKTEILLIQHRQGQSDALEKLVTLWERPLYYYVRRLVPTEDTAKDIAQETWLSAFRNIKKLRDPRTFPAWLYRIARNHAATHFRTTPHFLELSEDVEPPRGSVSSEPDILLGLNAEELHNGLKQMSPAHSECLILHFLEGFTLEEVARIQDVPLGTVKSRIYYAKEALREELTKGGTGQ